MKQILFLLLIISVVSCNKERDQSINGRWKIIESLDDTGLHPIPNSEANFIEFRSDGSFTMDNNNTYTFYRSLKVFNRYSIEPGSKIRFYNNTDTVLIGYFLDRELTISDPHWQEKFSR